MEIGFKVRCYPTKQQEEMLFQWCDFAHRTWNYLVAKYKDNLPKVNQFGIRNFSTTKLQEELKTNVPQRIALGAIKTYSRAVEGVYKRIGRWPHFHKYNPKHQSFYFSSMNYKNYGNYIVIRSLGKSQTKLKFSTNLKLGDILIEPRFTYDGRRWLMSGCYKVENVIKQKNFGIVGLDWGLKNFMTTSDGEYINYPSSVLREYQRIQKLQSHKDRKVRGSKNYNKIIVKIENAYNRFSNLKNNFIQQKTTQLCKNNSVAIEELTNAKIRCSNKTRRRIQLISPLSRFIKQLEWKCKKFGTYLYKVNPAYTSQTCSNCGKIHSHLTLADRTFICECGLVLDRDINAAINIAAKISCCNL